MIQQSKIQTIHRKDPCDCHSGLEYERCCGRTASFDEGGNTYRTYVTLTDANEPETGTREGSIIVKVQTALNDPTLPALIYDRGRTLLRHVDAEQVTERMQGRPKVFFYARLRYGQIVLEDEALAQGW